MRRKIILAAVFVVLAAVIGGFAYFQLVVKPQMVRGFIAGAPRPAVTVSAEPARIDQWERRRSAIGTFRAVQGVDITTEVAGVVRRIEFKSGADVKAGTLLVQLDDSVEQADLKSGLAELKKTDLDFRRQRELLTRGATSKTAYDAALSARDTAVAAIDRTKAVIAKKAIRAPFAGRLGIRNVDLGQYVSPGTAVVTLQQTDPIYVDFPLPEQAVADVRVGQDLEIRVDAYPGAAFKGKIQSLDARVSQETRTIQVRGELDNPDQRLWPGMFANVEVLVGSPREVVTVPRTAVTYSLYGDTVHVVVPAKGAGGKEGGLAVERRFVRLGDVRGDRVAIAAGLKPGERVVTSGQIKLTDGAAVRIDNAAAPKPPVPLPAE